MPDVKQNTPRLEFPRPHIAQQQIISEAKRFNVLCCGARFGKTTLGLDRICRPALDGYPAAWFAPTYKLLAEPWRDAITLLAPVISRQDATEHRIELITGGSLDFWTLEDADDNTARGRKYALAVIDEAAGVKNLMSVWQRLIRTRLSDYKGDAWFLSTPRGISGFKELFDRGTDPLYPEWMSWRMPTASNPHITPEEIESARHDLTEARFNQEYLAHFVNWEGAVFRRIREAVVRELQGDTRFTYNPIHEYVIGVDWGRSVDFTVFVVLDVTTRTVVHIDRSNQVDYSLQRGRLRALRDTWRPTAIIAEINSIGQPIIEQLGKDKVEVIPFHTSNASKSEAVEALVLAFERSEISIPDNGALISELEAFTGTVLPSGLIRYSAPEGQHDDITMALVMAWHGAFAGQHTLGLTELLRDGSYAREIRDMQVNKINRPQLVKPNVGENVKKCVECGSVAITLVGGILRCNQCGTQLSTNDTFQKPTSISRRDYLAKVG